MFSWSPSALSAFETCPKRFYHTRIAKDVEEPPSEASSWGSRVHEAIAEACLHGTPLPEDVAHCAPLVGSVKSARGTLIVEQKLALDDKREPVAWDAPEAWLRVVVDAALFPPDGRTAKLIDWKTGHPRNVHDFQLELYAAVLMAHHPAVERVDAAFVFVRDASLARVTLARDDLSRFWLRTYPRVEKMRDAWINDDYPALPNRFCRRWCPVSFCPHHGR